MYAIRSYYGSISVPLSALVKTMQKAKNGDFTTTLSANSNDEIGQVVSNFNDMLANIKELIKQVKLAVSDVITSSGKITSSSEQSYAASELV